MSLLLCDIGGTHIRLALSNGDKLDNIHKARVNLYENLEDAIASYLTSCHDQPQALYIATAARFDGTKWIFTNRNKWQLEPENFRSKFAFTDIRCINDFEANALGVIVAEKSDLVEIVASQKALIPEESRCVIGIGTGLGLAYLYGDPANPHVQQNYGGHMLPAIRSEESYKLFQFLSKQKKTPSIDIYEDALSGEGLYHIYRFICDQNHLDAEYGDISALMLHGKDHEIFRRAVDIFFEMLGLFTHQAVAFGYSYSGVYFTGGVIDRLMLAGLFARDKFFENFYQNNIPIVKNNVLSTPIYWIKDEFISLKGLLYLAEKEKNA